MESRRLLPCLDRQPTLSRDCKEKLRERLDAVTLMTSVKGALKQRREMLHQALMKLPSMITYTRFSKK